MKYLILIFTFLILSCSTATFNKEKVEKTKVWQITSIVQDGVEFFPETIKDAYAVYNMTLDTLTINYTYSDKYVDVLQSRWVKRNKKINVKELHVIQEVFYKIELPEAIVTKVSTGFILKGSNTRSYQEKLNNSSYDKTINESPGLIGKIIENSWPNLLTYIKTPIVHIGLSYVISITEDEVTIEGGDDLIKLKFQNEYTIINK